MEIHDCDGNNFDDQIIRFDRFQCWYLEINDTFTPIKFCPFCGKELKYATTPVQ